MARRALTVGYAALTLVFRRQAEQAPNLPPTLCVYVRTATTRSSRNRQGDGEVGKTGVDC